jgi:uncharacterized protein
MRFALLATLAVSVAAPALAAEDPIPRIIVTGTASVSTPPDRVLINFSLHGEGATSDEAIKAIADKRETLSHGLGSFAKAEPRSNTVNIQEVRGPGCNRQSYPVQPRLSTGECAIIGYTADQMMELRTAQVKDAGTLVGLVGRLGGTNPRIDHFFLSDDAAARSRAVAAAFAEARTQADAIAAGAKLTLGRILSVSDGSYAAPVIGDLMVNGANIPPPPPPPVSAPIPIPLTPRAIETQARVQVVYAISQ